MPVLCHLDVECCAISVHHIMFLDFKDVNFTVLHLLMHNGLPIMHFVYTSIMDAFFWQGHIAGTDETLG